MNSTFCDLNCLDNCIGTLFKHSPLGVVHDVILCYLSPKNSPYNQSTEPLCLVVCGHNLWFGCHPIFLIFEQKTPVTKSHCFLRKNKLIPKFRAKIDTILCN